MKIFTLLVMFFLFVSSCFSQLKTGRRDTLNKLVVSTNTFEDTIQNKHKSSPKTYEAIIDKLLKENKFLHFSGNASFLLHNQKNETGKEFLFYLISIIVLLLGVFKSLYSGYFNNILKVFFNTSLRQNQLTDILLQAPLPSLLFNLFFTVTGGVYIWLTLIHFHFLQPGGKRILIAASIALLGFIYFCKFLVLKFIGWVTGIKQVTDIYIFVTFLINKIVAILLIPFIVLLAFSPEGWGSIIVLLSFLSLSVLFILRFFRSYGIVGNQLSASRFHFFIYFTAIEILPLILMYKFLGKSLS